MVKSYSPMRPKAHKNPPDWAALLIRAGRFVRIETDDVVFDNAVITGHQKYPGLACVAYRDGRGRWYEVEVLKKRIKRQVGVAA